MDKEVKQDIQGKCDKIIENLNQAVVGKEKLLQHILVSFLAGGHVLIEDVPGVAKTLIANAISQVMDLEFGRIQFLPDLLPGDITGGFIYNAKLGDFEFKKGPIFAGLLLADEVNRGTPKTQSALLEAMQERKVTIEGKTYPLPYPFLVIATQNPIEFDGTYPLPEAQLDRFITRLQVGYPAIEEEADILFRRAERQQDEVNLPRIIDQEDFLYMQNQVEDVYVHWDIMKYIAELIQHTRALEKVEIGASPRGSLAVFKLSRAFALTQGRDYVVPDDVKEVLKPALYHRLILTPEARIERRDVNFIINETLNAITPPPIYEKGE